MREDDFTALRRLLEVAEQVRREVRYWEAEDGTLSAGARHIIGLLSDGIDEARAAIRRDPVWRP